jgi:hypothetical protein
MTSEEIINTYSDEVSLIIEKIRHKKDRLDLIRWLNNFDEADKPSALDILQRLVFVDDDQLHFEADALVEQLETASPPGSVFYFYPVAKYGKSATLVSYFFEHSPRFTALYRAGRAFFLSTENEVSGAVIYDDAVLVFFDDFLGSGGSFIKSYENMAKLSYSKFRTNPLQFAVSIYRMIAAESNISRHYPLMRFLGHTHPKLFDPANKMFSPAAEIVRQKAIAGNYAGRHNLFVNKEGPHPLGYKESEALISFAYRPPNNTLPIIWSSKKDRWHPFLPRFGAEIYTSVQDYKEKLFYAAAQLEFGLPRTSGGLKKVDKKYRNMLLVLSMLKRKTSAPLIAVIVGVSSKDLREIFDKAIATGYIDARLNVLQKGYAALKQIEKIVDEIKNTEKLKTKVKDHDIGYISKVVSGK